MYKRFVARRWLCLAAVAVLGAWTGLSMAQEKKPEPPKPKDIVDVAKETANLKTFHKLLESAGLAETLKGKGPFTVFAPTDQAFDKLGKEKLEELQKPEKKAELVRILKHHLLEGRKAAADVRAAKSLKPLVGNELTVTVKEEVVTVGGGKLIKTDVEASNGLIHVIDTVLMPAAE